MGNKKIQSCRHCPLRGSVSLQPAGNSLHAQMGLFYFDACLAPGAPKGRDGKIPTTLTHFEDGLGFYHKDDSDFPEWCPLPFTIEAV